MKLKFNRTERIAGTFVVVAMAGTIIAAATIFLQKGYLTPKVVFHTVVPSSVSVYPGAPVQMAGVRIGAVESVDLDETGSARVEFSVRKKYANRVKTDSQVSLMRPSLLGERIFVVSSGSLESPPAPAGKKVALQASKDPLTVLTGAKLAELMDHVDSLILEMTTVLRQVSHKKNVQQLLGNLRTTTDELNGRMPAIANDLAKSASHLAALTAEISKNSPEGDSRVAQLLDESTLLIQAIQRNFFFRGAVKDIRKEQAAKDLSEKEQDRLPAQVSEPEAQ